MRPISALLLLLLFGSAAFAARPSMPLLDLDEEARVQAGKVLLKTERQTDGALEAVVGVVDIGSEPSAIWPVLLDVNSMTASSRSIKEVRVQSDRTEADGRRRLELAFLLKVGFSEIRYNTIRSYTPADSMMTWALDKTKANDIAWTEGSYSTWPTAQPGRTRLLYKTKIDTGRNIPQWLEEDLTERSLKGFLQYVKDKAEGQR